MVHAYGWYEVAAMVLATTVAKGIAKDILYFNAYWRGNLAAAEAVDANSDTA